jgi:hypothetical protein
VRTEDYYKKTYENEYSHESEEEQTSWSSDDDYNLSDSSDSESESDEDIFQSLAAPPSVGTASKSQRRAVLEGQQIAQDFPDTYATRNATKKGRYL